MERTGKYIDAVLQRVHLNWGTTGLTDGARRNRHELEVYIPISSSKAEYLELRRGEEFNVSDCDFKLRASGSQGTNRQYGKNFESSGNLRLLGSHLKNVMGLTPGCTVRVEWISEDTVKISKI